MSTDPDHAKMKHARARFRLISFISDNLFGSVIALIFTVALLFIVYQGYLATKDTVYFTWIAQGIFLLAVLILAILLILLAVNVFLILTRGAASTAKEAAKNMADAYGEVNPRYKLKRDSVKLYLDQQRRGALPPSEGQRLLLDSGNTVEGSVSDDADR